MMRYKTFLELLDVESWVRIDLKGGKFQEALETSRYRLPIANIDEKGRVEIPRLVG